MKVVTPLLLCLAAAPTIGLAATPPTPPGWTFAKWGLTPAQLRAASHGTVRAGASGSPDQLNEEYAIGAFKFRVEFNYAPKPDNPGDTDEDNLVLDGITMGLDLKSGDCAALAAYLPKAFGKPDRVTRQGPLGYWWYKKGQAYDINYYSFPDRRCGIAYAPIGAS